MNWFVLALLSPALFTCVIFIDKYIVEREVPDARGVVIITAILSAIAGTLFWGIGGFILLPLRDTALVLAAGILNVIGAAVYFKAISSEVASSVIVFLQVIPIIVLVESFLFLGERLALEQLIGFGLILSAAVGVSLKRGTNNSFRLSSAFWLILLVAVLTASAQILFKSVSESYSFMQIVNYESWGIALGGLGLYLFVPALRQAFHRDLAAVRRRGAAALLFNETLYIVAKVVGYLALSLGSASLVSVLGSTQVFIAVLLGWLLTVLAPTIFREDISRRALLIKGAFAIAVFAGLVLVS